MLDFDLIFGRTAKPTAMATLDPPPEAPTPFSEPPITVRQAMRGGCCEKIERGYRLIGNGFSPTPLPAIDRRVLASPYRDPFAVVAVPSPMAGPPAAIPNYLIPATGHPALPLIVMQLTDRERALDSRAVAAACLVAVRAAPWFKEWPFVERLASGEVARINQIEG